MHSAVLARARAVHTPSSKRLKAPTRARSIKIACTMAATDIARLDVGARMSETRRDTPQVADDKSQDITGQTKQVLAQVDALLARAGSDKSRLLMVQIFLKDISQFPAMNAVWDSWVVPGSTPPRATVQALLADSAWLIEVVVTAAQASGSKL